jgi:hypothetical protein
MIAKLESSQPVIKNQARHHGEVRSVASQKERPMSKRDAGDF